MQNILVEHQAWWELSFNNSYINRINVDKALHLDVAPDEPRAGFAYSITIERPFQFQYGYHTLLIDPEFKVALTPVLLLVFNKIIEGKAYKNGDLEIILEQNRKIFVPYDASFEAWQLNDRQGKQVVSSKSCKG